ncbi:MAG: hypothetical protein WC359_13285 [Dehalococcoidia bacterium]|jgi:hypothetical protein
MHPAVITITTTGQIEVIYHSNAEPDMRNVGVTVADQRGAYVLPDNVLLRYAFKALRWMFGSRGKVSDWTRRWMCEFSLWRASDNQRLPGVYHGHDEAVKVEVKMLEEGVL